jgi:hypothetical protein
LNALPAKVRPIAAAQDEKPGNDRFRRRAIAFSPDKKSPAAASWTLDKVFD